jgi:hypothetical protein
VWTSPGGNIDPGESPFYAAVREFNEEMGYGSIVPGILPRFTKCLKFTPTKVTVMYIGYINNITEILPFKQNNEKNGMIWADLTTLETNCFESYDGQNLRPSDRRGFKKLYMGGNVLPVTKSPDQSKCHDEKHDQGPYNGDNIPGFKNIVANAKFPATECEDEVKKYIIVPQKYGIILHSGDRYILFNKLTKINHSLFKVNGNNIREVRQDLTSIVSNKIKTKVDLMFLIGFKIETDYNETNQKKNLECYVFKSNFDFGTIDLFNNGLISQRIGTTEFYSDISQFPMTDRLLAIILLEHTRIFEIHGAHNNKIMLQNIKATVKIDGRYRYKFKPLIDNNFDNKIKVILVVEDSKCVNFVEQGKLNILNINYRYDIKRLSESKTCVVKYSLYKIDDIWKFIGKLVNHVNYDNANPTHLINLK